MIVVIIMNDDRPCQGDRVNPWDAEETDDSQVQTSFQLLLAGLSEESTSGHVSLLRIPRIEPFTLKKVFHLYVSLQRDPAVSKKKLCIGVIRVC